MTESEWLTCTDPVPMLDLLRWQATDRKLRLFAMACCRHIPVLRTHPVVGRALDLGEEYADGRVDRAALRGANYDAWDVMGDPRYRGGPVYGNPAVRLVDAASRTDLQPPLLEVVILGVNAAFPAASSRRSKVPAALLRDIFGPLPFRPLTIEPSVLAWNDRLVVRLAQGIYDERRWGDMPVLADALLDAGCDNEAMLSHAREQGSSHVRGCWVLDLLLNKE